MLEPEPLDLGRASPSDELDVSCFEKLAMVQPVAAGVGLRVWKPAVEVEPDLPARRVQALGEIRIVVHVVDRDDTADRVGEPVLRRVLTPQDVVDRDRRVAPPVPLPEHLRDHSIPRVPREAELVVVVPYGRADGTSNLGGSHVVPELLATRPSEAPERAEVAARTAQLRRS